VIELKAQPAFFQMLEKLKRRVPQVWIDIWQRSYQLLREVLRSGEGGQRIKQAGRRVVTFVMSITA
jgi:hypothetical protein